jgi:hypothetical protein
VPGGRGLEQPLRGDGGPALEPGPASPAGRTGRRSSRAPVGELHARLLRRAAPSAWSRCPQAARSPRPLPSSASTTATSRHPPDQQRSPTTRHHSASRCTRSPGSSAPPRT